MGGIVLSTAKTFTAYHMGKLGTYLLGAQPHVPKNPIISVSIEKNKNIQVL